MCENVGCPRAVYSTNIYHMTNCKQLAYMLDFRSSRLYIFLKRSLGNSSQTSYDLSSVWRDFLYSPYTIGRGGALAVIIYTNETPIAFWKKRIINYLVRASMEQIQPSMPIRPRHCITKYCERQRLVYDNLYHFKATPSSQVVQGVAHSQHHYTMMRRDKP